MVMVQNNPWSVRYILITAVSVLVTWLLHEFSHWLVGEALGYEMIMALNQAYLKSGDYATEAHEKIVSAAGPVTTLVQGLILFYLIRKFGSNWLYPALMTCFYSRFMAGAMTIFNPNDEARISSYLGLGTYTLPVIVISLLFWLLYITSVRNNYRPIFNLGTLLLVIFFSSALILIDQFYPVKLL